MNKICTSIEQSKKLIELGLDVNTGDMYYEYVLPKSDKIKHNPQIGNPVNALEWYNKGYTTSGKKPIKLNEYCIPAWSLSALLDVINQVREIKHQRVTMLVGRFAGNHWYVGLSRVQDERSVLLEHSKELVDACYEMILKLKELKLL